LGQGMLWYGLKKSAVAWAPGQEYIFAKKFDNCTQRGVVGKQSILPYE